MELTQIAQNIYSQLTAVITELKDAEYSKPLPLLMQASIGMHMRHIVEFFDCLHRGVEEGTICYDDRKHDKFIESDRLLAQRYIDRFIDLTSKLNIKDPVQLVSKMGNKEDITANTPSSIERELIYNIEHAIHHMAIIKIGIGAYFEHVVLPEGFGYAASTIRYRKEQHVHSDVPAN